MSQPNPKPLSYLHVIERRRSHLHVLGQQPTAARQHRAGVASLLSLHTAARTRTHHIQIVRCTAAVLRRKLAGHRRQTADVGSEARWRTDKAAAAVAAGCCGRRRSLGHGNGNCGVDAGVASSGCDARSGGRVRLIGWIQLFQRGGAAAVAVIAAGVGAAVVLTVRGLHVGLLLERMRLRLIEVGRQERIVLLLLLL